MSSERSEVDWASAYRYLEQQLELVVRRLEVRMEELERQLRGARRPRIRAVKLQEQPDGTLRCVVPADGSGLKYSFIIYRGDLVVREEPLGESNTLIWMPERRGTYRVRVTVQRWSQSATAHSAVSGPVKVGGAKA